MTCFAYHEYWKHGIRHLSCSALNYGAFAKVMGKRGGCCEKNCPFYKENPEMIRSDYGYHPMSKNQIETRNYYSKK